MALRTGSLLVVAVGLVIGLSGCAGTGADDGPTAGTTHRASTSASSTPSAAASSATAASDDERVASFCAANAAAAEAVQGDVAGDILARQRQAEATRALLPVPGAASDVSAGAEKFAAAADETVAILRTFPPESKVSDVGTDPRFLQSDAMRAVASDAQYRAFLAWVLETCMTTQ
ncbi:hypothetical protein [uncultured Curtobacterium sp.]|uniref:hypothetical protein n=1 Tax=uncultured Curtobacterium sp. TaxID=331964 RepID=UPI002590E9DC|nr:hypothetical protein [uncultured Curtobacterium sp.]